MWTVTTNDHQNLILIKSDETLDFNSLRNVLKQIYFENEGRYSSYNRFADLSGLEKIEVDIDTLVSNVQVYRKVNPPKDDVKIAVFLSFGTTSALAQLYKMMTEDDAFGIQVFRALDECADYLSVDKALLWI